MLLPTRTHSPTRMMAIPMGLKVRDVYLLTVLFVTIQCLNKITQESLNDHSSFSSALFDDHYDNNYNAAAAAAAPKKNPTLTQSSSTQNQRRLTTRKRREEEEEDYGGGGSQDSITAILAKEEEEEISSALEQAGRDPSVKSQQRMRMLSAVVNLNQQQLEQQSSIVDSVEREEDQPEEEVEEKDRSARATASTPNTTTSGLQQEQNQQQQQQQQIFECDTNNTICCASMDSSEPQLIDEWWTHHPDWEEIPMSVEEQEAQQDISNSNKVCFQPMELTNPKKATFFRQLYVMQFAFSNNNLDWCQNHDLQVWQINAGYGASINQITKGLWAAYNQGRPFQMTKHWEGAQWLYATNSTKEWNYCSSQDMNCYFLPLGNCLPQPRRNDNYKQSATNTREEKRKVQWVRQYITRIKHIVRKRVYQKLLELEQSSSLLSLSQLENNCTVMHVRRGDVGYARHPYRRYAAVSEYLDVGNITQGSNIVVLTDDETTLQEINTYHSGGDYNWIWMDRPRVSSTNNGMDGHIPSGHEGNEIIAILAEVKLASLCNKIVHGHSGFVTLIKDAMDGIGRNYTSVYIDTKVTHKEMKQWRTKFNPAGRAKHMMDEIHSLYVQQQKLEQQKHHQQQQKDTTTAPAAAISTTTAANNNNLPEKKGQDDGISTPQTTTTTTKTNMEEEKNDQREEGEVQFTVAYNHHHQQEEERDTTRSRLQAEQRLEQQKDRVARIRAIAKETLAVKGK